MFSRRSTRLNLLFSLIACVLLCTIATSEIPELLTFRNDTSNDFTLRESASAEGARVLNVAKQMVVQVSMETEAFATELVTTVEVAPPADLPLFLLNSILRT
jgi:hypothetical protein